MRRSRGSSVLRELQSTNGPKNRRDDNKSTTHDDPPQVHHENERKGAADKRRWSCPVHVTSCRFGEAVPSRRIVTGYPHARYSHTGWETRKVLLVLSNLPYVAIT